MNNHPNRASRASPMAATVKAAREAAGLTPEQAGALVHERGRRWTDFESGTARMHPAAWELFRIKTQRLQVEGPSTEEVYGRMLASVTTGRHAAAPQAGETWYSKDTGCAVVVTHVEAGLVTARGLRSTVETTAGDWFDNFQREPIAV